MTQESAKSATVTSSERDRLAEPSPSAVRAEIGRMRKRDVDRRVIARIDAVEGDASTEQIEQWERDAYRLWRETWPALNGLLLPHSTEETS